MNTKHLIEHLRLIKQFSYITLRPHKVSMEIELEYFQSLFYDALIISKDPFKF